MTQYLTDAQLEFAMRYMFAGSRQCGLVIASGYDDEYKRPWSNVCPGNTTIKDGLVEIKDFCGRQCHFVSGEAKKTQEAINTLQEYAGLVDAARNNA